MMISWDTAIYCLIGHPISKSLSPIIHNNYFNLIGKNNIYLTFDVEEEDLEMVVNTLKILNIKGFNVTLPHKIKIMEYLDEIDSAAKMIGAVNTVKNENGKLIGYNTDGIGFLKSLEMLKINIENKTALILGSGGAANAISTSLAIAGAKKIFINNRSLSKAKILAEKIKKQFPEIIVDYGGLELNNICKDEIDIVINCTSVGMFPNIDETPIKFDGFSKELIVYDVIYKPRKTKFLQLAEDRGYFAVGGLSMLINQALCSQNIWLNDEHNNINENFYKIEGILKSHVE
jgi:shikimate dehydrogenase